MPTDAGCLDFALVRVDRPRGAEWGCFPIVRSDFGFGLGAPILIAGHPVELERSDAVFSSKRAGRRLVCSIEPRSSMGTNPNFTRARYRTNTLPGSSGSPVFDDRFEFIALHHFGRTGSYNQGIPLAAIHAHLDAAGSSPTWCDEPVRRANDRRRRFGGRRMTSRS